MDSGGPLAVITHSAVDSFTFGTVHVSKVAVDISATSTLSGGSGDAHVTAGQVTANGQPVAVSDRGVTVQDKHPIPCTSAPAPKPPVASPPVAAPSPPAGPLPPLPVGGSGGGSSNCGAARAARSYGLVSVVLVTMLSLCHGATT